MKTGKIVQSTNGYLVVQSEDDERFLIPLPNTVIDNAHSDHEIRLLRWKLKNLGKQNGQASRTIHQLRAELALMREKLWGALPPQRWVAGVGGNDVPGASVLRSVEAESAKALEQAIAKAAEESRGPQETVRRISRHADCDHPQTPLDRAACRIRGAEAAVKTLTQDNPAFPDNPLSAEAMRAMGKTTPE